MFSIPLGLLVWMGLKVLMLMMSVLTYMAMMILIMILMMILTMILMILMMMLMMILMMVGAGTCILPKFPAAAVNIFCANS